MVTVSQNQPLTCGYNKQFGVVEQIRNSFVLGTLWAAKRNALVVGSSGAGKTVLVFSELARLPDTHSQLVMNFSATTDSGTTQVKNVIISHPFPS